MHQQCRNKCQLRWKIKDRQGSFEKFEKSALIVKDRQLQRRIMSKTMIFKTDSNPYNQYNHKVTIKDKLPTIHENVLEDLAMILEQERTLRTRQCFQDEILDQADSTARDTNLAFLAEYEKCVNFEDSEETVRQKGEKWQENVAEMDSVIKTLTDTLEDMDSVTYTCERDQNNKKLVKVSNDKKQQTFILDSLFEKYLAGYKYDLCPISWSDLMFFENEKYLDIIEKRWVENYTWRGNDWLSAWDMMRRHVNVLRIDLNFFTNTVLDSIRCQIHELAQLNQEVEKSTQQIEAKQRLLKLQVKKSEQYSVQADKDLFKFADETWLTASTLRDEKLKKELQDLTGKIVHQGAQAEFKKVLNGQSKHAAQKKGGKVAQQ